MEILVIGKYGADDKRVVFTDNGLGLLGGEGLIDANNLEHRERIRYSRFKNAVISLFESDLKELLQRLKDKQITFTVYGDDIYHEIIVENLKLNEIHTLTEVEVVLAMVVNELYSRSAHGDLDNLKLHMIYQRHFRNLYSQSFKQYIEDILEFLGSDELKKKILK